MNKQETIIRSEQAVIGCLLRDNDSFDEITELDSSAFSREDHQIIYKSIVGFLHDGKPVDLIFLLSFSTFKVISTGLVAYLTYLS